MPPSVFCRDQCTLEEHGGLTEHVYSWSEPVAGAGESPGSPPETLPQHKRGNIALPDYNTVLSTRAHIGLP